MPVHVTDTSTGRGFRSLVLAPQLSRVWERAAEGEFGTDRSIREMMDDAGFDIMDLLEFVFLPVLRAKQNQAGEEGHRANCVEVGQTLQQHGYGRDLEERENTRRAAMTVHYSLEEANNIVSGMMGDRLVDEATAS